MTPAGRKLLRWAERPLHFAEQEKWYLFTARARSVLRLWKSLRNDPGQGSDHRRKVTGLKSESVTDFIPES